MKSNNSLKKQKYNHNYYLKNKKILKKKYNIWVKNNPTWRAEYYRKNIKKFKKYHKKYYERNSRHLINTSIEWQKQHPRKKVLIDNRYHIKNKSKFKKWSKQYYKKKSKEVKLYSKDWQRKHPIRNKRNYRNILCRKFGLTYKDYDALVRKQNGRCAICKQKETRRFNNKIMSLSLDHNHKTGRPRGLLCKKCNSTLGYVNENLVILKNMIKYIKKWNK